MDQDRFRHYVNTQRASARFQRLADVVFLGIVLVALAGSAVGLLPEIEKSKVLDAQLAEEQAKLDAGKAQLADLKLKLKLLRTDVIFMEQELRNNAPRVAKPGETLIMIPPERRAVYEAPDSE